MRKRGSGIVRDTSLGVSGRQISCLSCSFAGEKPASDRYISECTPLRGVTASSQVNRSHLYVRNQ